jgi:hypothetical protein
MYEDAPDRSLLDASISNVKYAGYEPTACPYIPAEAPCENQAPHLAHPGGEITTGETLGTATKSGKNTVMEFWLHMPPFMSEGVRMLESDNRLILSVHTLGFRLAPMNQGANARQLVAAFTMNGLPSQFLETGVRVETCSSYHVLLEVSENDWSISVDGELKASSQILPESPIPEWTDKLVYYNPYDTIPSAEGWLTDVKISAYCGVSTRRRKRSVPSSPYADQCGPESCAPLFSHAGAYPSPDQLLGTASNAGKGSGNMALEFWLHTSSQFKFASSGSY